MNDFEPLNSYLRRVPGLTHVVGDGSNEDGTWWVKFKIDIDHPLAWKVVQEFANVLNLLSVMERLPTVFKPVSPPSYLNGGPREYLSWVVESTEPGFSPATCAEWLEGRLPRPVEDLAEWADLVDDAEESSSA